MFSEAEHTWGSLLDNDDGSSSLKLFSERDENGVLFPTNLKKILIKIYAESKKVSRVHTVAIHPTQELRKFLGEFQSANETTNVNPAQFIEAQLDPEVFKQNTKFISHLFMKKASDLKKEDEQMKTMLRNALTVVMQKLKLATDSVRNDTDVAAFWDVVTTFFLNGPPPQRNETAEFVPEKETSNVKVVAAVGAAVLILLAVTGLMTAFCLYVALRLFVANRCCLSVHGIQLCAPKT